jgi:hypothetical protein
VTVAALYVDPKGVYAGLPDVEVWGEKRDARTYAGPWPVVAHPPCARWSRLAGFTEARFGLKRGDDGGCFAAALKAVRKWGGIIEHPAYTDAWKAFGLPRPSTWYGWTTSLLDPGATAYVEQGRYGLPVKKATWLYAVGVVLPELRWGYVSDGDGDGDGRMASWRDTFGGRRGQLEQGGTHLAACVVDGVRVKSPHFGLTSTTPPDFRDVLLATARTAAAP